MAKTSLFVIHNDQLDRLHIMSISVVSLFKLDRATFMPSSAEFAKITEASS